MNARQRPEREAPSLSDRDIAALDAVGGITAPVIHRCTLVGMHEGARLPMKVADVPALSL